MKKPLWKAEWMIGAAVTLIFMSVLGLPQTQRLERVFYDLGVLLSSARPVGDDVMVVAIDEASVSELGSLPLPRDQIARVISTIGEARPKTIGVALDLSILENPRALSSLDALSTLMASASGKEMSPIFARRVETALQDARRGLATDDYLAFVLRNTRNVVLAMSYRPGRSRVTSAMDADNLSPFALSDPSYAAQATSNFWHYLYFYQPLVEAQAITVPNAKVMAHAGGLGHFGAYPDVDGRQRFEPLVIGYRDNYYPSLVLAMYAKFQRKSPADVTIGNDYKMIVGDATFPVDTAFRYLPFFYDQDKGKEKNAYQVVSFKDIYRGRVKASMFRDKAVLIGVTYAGAVPEVTLPTGVNVAPVMFQADALASLISGDGYVAPLWNAWLQLVTIALIGLYLGFVVPRVKFATGLAISAVIVVLLVNVYTIVMVSQGMVLALIAPIIPLVIGHALLAIKHHYHASTSRWRAESAESNRMLGLAFQSQGQLDMAFEKFQRCPVERGVLELLYSLGLDYERRRQFAKAGVVFQYIDGYDRGFRDVKKRILSNREMEGVYRKGGGNGSAGAANGTMVLSNSMVQKPMLGRYEVQRELGRGAMGMVYLGEDPKINRVVAIKTVALSHEFEAEELEAVKARFFREASTAGRLNHPNIVTIYDVGEEQDLAYIAMDYLEGENLLPYTKSDNLLSVQEVFYIISAIAKALDYAHSENVVHRDIKPANIMYDRETKKVKITDFGVACLIDASKTKTGTILGTPSYMSPEQLSSSRVDGRSDIFSLGVMLFQLLTGELPFVAESMAALMYKITHEREPDIKMFRPELPTCINQILRRALAKEVEQRFQRGTELVTALQKCQVIVERRDQKAS